MLAAVNKLNTFEYGLKHRPKKQMNVNEFFLAIFLTNNNNIDNFVNIPVLTHPMAQAPFRV